MLLLGGDDIIVGRLLDRDGDVLLCVGEVNRDGPSVQGWLRLRPGRVDYAPLGFHEGVCQGGGLLRANCTRFPLRARESRGIGPMIWTYCTGVDPRGELRAPQPGGSKNPEPETEVPRAKCGRLGGAP